MLCACVCECRASYWLARWISPPRAAWLPSPPTSAVSDAVCASFFVVPLLECLLYAVVVNSLVVSLRHCVSVCVCVAAGARAASEVEIRMSRELDDSAVSESDCAVCVRNGTFRYDTEGPDMGPAQSPADDKAKLLEGDDEEMGRGK